MKSNPHIDSDGTKYWHNKKGQLHRTDGPAIIYKSGTKTWWQNGERHRIDGPAEIYNDGYKAWYQNGECHRTDGPAEIYKNGTKHWFINDKPIKPIPDHIILWSKKLDA